MNGNAITVTIHPDPRSAAGQSYVVTIEPHWSVLDALERIRVEQEPDLLYRHSCHHGSCGTCGMLVNGQKHLACITKLCELPDREVHLAPLPAMRHLGDLAVDPTPLFADFPIGATYLRASQAHRDASPPEEISRFVRFENCIECGLCMQACPVLPDGDFMGPAALAAYNRETENRPERSTALLAQVNLPRGAAACKRHLACSQVCPTGVYPAKHIAVLKRKIKRAAGPE